MVTEIMKEKPQRLLAEHLRQVMSEKDVSLRQLAEKAEITYEHARRIASGEGAPSKWVLQGIAEILEVDLHELQRLATFDKICKEYGEEAATMLSPEPGLAHIQNYWYSLSDEQKNKLVGVVNGFLKGK